LAGCLDGEKCLFFLDGTRDSVGIERRPAECSFSPLNIQGNRSHPFAIELYRLRKEAIHNARELPIADETQQARNP